MEAYRHSPSLQALAICSGLSFSERLGDGDLTTRHRGPRFEP
jgi:hypothetical protein